MGTTSVEASSAFSDKLTQLDIPHEVLNAKPEALAREAEIIAQAGRRGAVRTARGAYSRTDLRPGVPQAPRVHPQPRLVRHSLERRAPDPVLRARCGLLLQLFSHSSMNPIFRAPRWTLSRLSTSRDRIVDIFDHLIPAVSPLSL